MTFSEKNAHQKVTNMKTLSIHRVLSFCSPSGNVTRGPLARGTLVISEDSGGRFAKFIRDIDGDSVEIPFSEIEIIDCVPKNKKIVVKNKERVTSFTSYKEIPVSEDQKTYFSIIRTGVNAKAGIE